MTIKLWQVSRARKVNELRDPIIFKMHSETRPDELDNFTGMEFTILAPIDDQAAVDASRAARQLARDQKKQGQKDQKAAKDRMKADRGNGTRGNAEQNDIINDILEYLNLGE